MLRRTVVKSLSALLLAAALFGCSRSSGETSRSTQTADAGQIREIALSEAWAFDSGFSPLTLQVGNYGIMYYANNFYETLVNYDNGKIVPGLAESWEISDDGLIYTFHLRKDVQFTDGAPFDAEAVKTNLECIPANLGIFNGFYGVVTTLFDEIKVIDAHTVEVRLTHPYYGALNDFSMRLPLAMVSPNGYNGDGALSDTLKTATLGTGPYMYAGETDGTTYTFTTNPAYWGTAPDLDRFHVKVISDNDARQLALRNGEIDALVGTRQISHDGFRELQDAGFGAVVSPIADRTEYLALNTQKAPFDDTAVRRAANYALDKAVICRNILGGIDEAAEYFFPEGTAYCGQELSPYAYDKEKALDILEGSGWLATGDDGIRRKNGVPLEGVLLYASDKIIMEDIALVLCARLKEIGMNIKPLAMEVAACYAAQANGEYDLAHTFTYGGVWDPHTTIANAKPSPDITATTGVLNRAFALIDNAGELIDELNTSADTGRIEAIYTYLMTKVHDQALFIPLYYPKEIAVYNQNVIRDYTFAGTYNTLGYVDVASIKLK